MWKAADPRHHFNQGGRGYWWRHACSRLVIHIASIQTSKQTTWTTENVLDSTSAKKPTYTVYSRMSASSSWQTGSGGARIIL